MKKHPDRSPHRAIEALKAAVENPGPSRAMSKKRKFLLDHFETIQQARNRKPRPLSYKKIAKIMTQNGYKVSSQLVGAVCKERTQAQWQGGLDAIDGTANKLAQKADELGEAATKLDTAATKLLGGVEGKKVARPRKCPTPRKRPES